MRKLIATSIALFYISLSVCPQKKSVITEIITYKVNLKLDENINQNTFIDPSLVYEQLNSEWYQNKLSPASYQIFVKQIHEAAKSGKVKTYDLYEISGFKPVFTKLTPYEVCGIGSDTTYVTLQRPTPPYDDFDTTIISSFDITEIVQIEFMEKWTINTKNMEIKKDIIAHALWRKRRDPSTGEFKGLSRMYWVKP